MPVETTLTLGLPPEALEPLCQHPLVQRYRTGEALQQHKEVQYLDTPARLLGQQGLRLILAQEAEHCWQRLRLIPDQGTLLAAYPSWRAVVPSANFELSAFSALPEEWRTSLESVAPRLEVVCHSQIERTELPLKLRDGTRVRLCIDRGQLHVGQGPKQRREPILELRLILEKGSPTKMLSLARRLAADLPLWPEYHSRAQRALAFSDRQRVQPLKVVSPEGEPEKAAGPLLAAGLARCQYALLGNLDMIREASLDDPEWVHQARVALRRIRTLLHMAKPLMPRRTKAIRERLYPLAQALGQVRDRDVLLHETLPRLMAQTGPHPADVLLLERLHHERLQALAALQTELRSPRSAQGLLMLERLRLGLLERRRPSSLDLARSALKAAYRSLVSAAEAAQEGTDSEAWHRVRIAAKGLRYGLESYTGLWKPSKLRRWLQALARLQEQLGQQNDYSQAIALLEPLRPERNGCAASDLPLDERLSSLVQAARATQSPPEAELQALLALPLFWKPKS